MNGLGMPGAGMARPLPHHDGSGLHAPQHVGPKKTGECWRFIQLKGGKWSAVSGRKYLCTGLTRG